MDEVAAPSSVAVAGVLKLWIATKSSGVKYSAGSMPQRTIHMAVMLTVRASR